MTNLEVLPKNAGPPPNGRKEDDAANVTGDIVRRCDLAGEGRSIRIPGERGGRHCTCREFGKAGAN
jgi:hypothetical protein